MRGVIMGKSTNTEPSPELSFEEAIQSLEQIVKDMESERLPLDQLVRRYEEGSRLLRTCEQRIREAEQRIELIAAGEAGPEVKGFEPAKQAPAAVENRGSKVEAKKAPLAKEPVADEGGDSEEEEIQLF
jgi:exodeoxyribonuclease VII small subunit